jgi:hypothetical protein
VNGYNVRCPYCGQEWRSTSVSGVTRRGECRTRVYVRVDERPRRYVEEQRARRRSYGRAAKSRPTRRGERRRKPDECDPDDPGTGLNDRARPAKERRKALGKIAHSRPSPARPSPLSTALASLLTQPPAITRPPSVEAPVPRARRAGPHSQPSSGAPPLTRTRAVLACGHLVILGGPPESWCGVAAPCPTCGYDVNVISTKPASVTGPAGMA